MKHFTFNLRDGMTKTMEFDEFVRWACLIEALEVVGGKIDCIDNNKWIISKTLGYFDEFRTNLAKKTLKSFLKSVSNNNYGSSKT